VRSVGAAVGVGDHRVGFVGWLVMQSGGDGAPTTSCRRQSRTRRYHDPDRSGKGPVPPRIRGRTRPAGFKTDHSLARPCSRGEPDALQLLQTADGETARLRIVDARIVQPQVDEAESSAAIRIAASRLVQRSASTSRARAERISCSGLEPSSAEPGPQPASAGRADVIARDDEIGTVICDAAYRGMQTRVSVFPWAMPSPSPVPRSLSIWPTR
jgi:hypothetical protein